MFDHIDPRFGGDADAFAAVRVCGDFAAQAVRLIDTGAQLVDRKLRGEGVGAGRHVSARGHHFDPVHARFDVLPHGFADAEFAVRFASHEPAVAAGGGDRRASHQQPWAKREAARERLTHFDREAGRRAEVADGGDARFEHATAVLSHTQGHRGRGVRVVNRAPIGSGVEAEVGVAFDQAGDDGAPREV